MSSDRDPPSAGVMGWPVAHSKSPLIHRFWLGKLGIDGDYGRFPVEPSFLGDAIRAVPAIGLRGVNITVPHKTEVISCLDRIDPVAASIGAVNTVVVEDWQLVGYNTDARGFIEPLLPLFQKQHLALGRDEHPCRIAHLVGCGGAALAIAAALNEHDFTFITYNRDPAKAKQKLAGYIWDDDLNLTLSTLAQSETDLPWQGEPPDPARIDLFVNATTLGMAGNPPLQVAPERLPPGMIVYDIVYSPLETPLLAAARARKLRTIDGLAMLIAQAAAAFALFFGVPAPREHDAELRALLTT